MSRARALADIVAGTIDKTAGSPVDSQSVTAGTSDVRARPKVSTSLTQGQISTLISASVAPVGFGFHTQRRKCV